MALNGTTAIGVGKGYTNLVALGLSNVSINGTTVTFTLNDGETASVTLPTPKDGEDGKDGKNIEFNWDGTKLGVRVQGTSEYSYVDLKGTKGDKGDAGEVAISFIIVEELPEVGENGVMYLVPNEDESDKNIYDEYMYIENYWECIGSTSVNLENYYTKTEVDAKVKSVYSTDETVIGTWIDNKPIYRKVIRTTMPSSLNGSTYSVNVPISITNLDTVVTYSTMLENSNMIFPICSAGNTIGMLSATNVTSTFITIRRNGDQTLSSGTNIRFIIEYTKTTD